MALRPGILTDWPWKPLGSFKYILWAPWVLHSTYSYLSKEEGEGDVTYLLIFPTMLLRMLHNQIWISFSRYKTAKGKKRIVNKGIEFDQVDRERGWDDQIMFNGLLFYIVYMIVPEARNLPFWRLNGVILTSLLHVGPVEFLYYWLHRALHHHFLYSRYHSHHHSSIATEPITSVIHPFAEHIIYFILFSIPLYTSIITRTASIASFFLYLMYIDFMNNMGHCNFEFVPKWLFSIFPPLKYIMYTPSFHSLHHTMFRTNYSLFMPFYDYIYGTMDKTLDTTYEASLKREEDRADCVYLTHLTTPQSIYHNRLGIASWASKPQTSKWFIWAMWPFTCWSVLMASIYGRTFVCERNSFKKLKLQSWVVPRYNFQYLFDWRKASINQMIEEAILDADKRGVKVISLGLLNQNEELNKNGELYIQKYPQLKVKIVDGTSLAVAIVVNTLPKGTTDVLLMGKLNKVAYALVSSLCQRGIQVATDNMDAYEKLTERVPLTLRSNLIHITSSSHHKVWLVGDDLSEKEQTKASKGTTLIPFSQFPPRKFHKQCFYHTTPAMMVPPSLENMDSCENWLPRRVMSAWRIAGIIHALEGWKMSECGEEICGVDRVWEATLRNGFRPFI